MALAFSVSMMQSLHVVFTFSTGHLAQLEQEELQNFVLPRLEPFEFGTWALLVVGSEEFPEFTRFRLPSNRRKWHRPCLF